MRIEFRLPSLGADMDSATLTEWLKQPGDPIAHGEPIVTVETAKGLIDVEAYENGRVVDLVVAPGTKVPVGAVLAHLDVAEVAHATDTDTRPPDTIPALLDADRKDLPTLMRDCSALVTRVRADGADVLYPIINPPQVAIGIPAGDRRFRRRQACAPIVN